MGAVIQLRDKVTVTIQLWSFQPSRSDDRSKGRRGEGDGNCRAYVIDFGS